LAITLPLAAVLNIWQDEAYTLDTTGRGFAYAFHQAIGFEQNAPLYFVFMTFWRHFGNGIFYLRLPSVLCVALTVALVPAIARRYFPRENPLPITAVVACNPFVIWAGVEMRVYAFVILLSALLLLAFYDAFAKERPGIWPAIGYAACVAAALYTQYYMAFLIAGQGIAVAIYYRRALARFVFAVAAGALSFVPMIALLPGQVQNFKDGFAAPSLLRALVGLLGILLRYVLPLPLVHSKLAYAGIGAALALALLVTRPRLSRSGNASVLVTTLCATVLFAAGTFAFGVHVLDRHAASLYLPSTLSVFALFSFLTASVERRAAVAWSCAAVVLSLLTLGRTYGALAKPGDWARVAAYIHARETADEPIVVFEAENAVPLAYYYHGLNRIVPIPHGVDFHRYQVTRFVIHDQAELIATMPSERRLWLVTAGSCASSDVEFGCERLERFVARRYRVQSDVNFYGAEVRGLERAGTR
jgi:4-amino-4-deoxy-L-arabinose transferase-like glycosyltransferase